MKQDQFALIPIEVALDRRLTQRQMRVLIALFSFRGKNTNTVWPSRASIASRTNMDETRISVATTDLVKLGWLLKVGEGGHSKATRYTLCVPEIEATTIPESGTVKAKRTVPESGRVNVSSTIPESGTVPQNGTVPESGTRPLPESGTPPLPESGRGKEHTNEQTNRTDHSRRGNPAAEKPVRTESEISADKTETELQAACRETWAAYGEAYERRYGARPVRNASVNSRVKQFVQRIGYDESPAVARFYVDSVTDAFVLRKVHEVGLLLSGAEGYRTQWASGRTADAQPNRQEAQESRNRAVANEWLQQQGAHA